MPYAYGLTTECYELDGSPQESYNEGSFKGTIRLRCAWANRYALAGEIANYTLWPLAAGLAARSRSMSILPFSQVQGATVNLSADYEQAVLTVDYVFDKDTPQESGGELFAESLEPTAQNLTQDWQSFKWKNGPQIEPGEAPSKLFKGLDYVLTKYNLAAVPAAALTLVGCCNAAQVVSATLGLTFPAQTLLFNPPSLQRKVSAGSSPSLKWTATYRMSYNPGGWNTFWNARKAGGPGWDTLQVKLPAGGYVDYVQYPPAAFSGF